MTVSGDERALESVNVPGSALALTLVSAVTLEDTVTVNRSAPDRESEARLGGTAGNAVASFTGQSVTNETAPPAFMASIHNAPESHNGQDVFTFKLRFSETPKNGFSCKTLRDRAFTVTGGTMTGSVRVEKGSNIGWELHVEPNSNADVTIVLPVTENCDGEGAICTSDGRKLSSRLELTVSGPDG